MSEFTDRLGHDVQPSLGYCMFCGPVWGRPVRMDGKSNRQLRAEEEEWDKVVHERELDRIVEEREDDE